MTDAPEKFYDEKVDDAIENEKIDVLLRHAYGGPCACFTREGEPACVCQMFSDAVRRKIVPAWLKRGRIVRIKS